MISSDSDLRLLRIFRTVADVGGLACAQAELNLSLSTISGYLTSLEARLGVKLCQRGRSGFRLTEQGRVVYDETNRLLSSISHFNDRMGGLNNAPSGILRIGLADNTISDETLPLNTILGRLDAEAPNVVLNVVTKPPNELMKGLLSGALHAAIASFPRTTSGLCYMKLYSEMQFFYCGKDHPLFARAHTPVDLEEIAAHAIVGRPHCGELDKGAFPEVSPRVIVNDIEAEARLILSGRFVGYLPSHYARSFEETGRLRAIRTDVLRYRAIFRAAYKGSEAICKGSPLALFLRLVKQASAPAAPASCPIVQSETVPERV